MGKRYKLKFLPKGYGNDKQVYEKRLNMISHLENENKNHN